MLYTMHPVPSVVLISIKLYNEMYYHFLTLTAKPPRPARSPHSPRRCRLSRPSRPLSCSPQRSPPAAAAAAAAGAAATAAAAAAAATTAPAAAAAAAAAVPYNYFTMPRDQTCWRPGLVTNLTTKCPEASLHER